MPKRKKFGISSSLTQGLSKTIHVVTENAGSMRYEVVDLSRILLDPNNPRELSIQKEDLPQGPTESDLLYAEKSIDLQSLQSLANTIKQKGVMNPIWLYKDGENYTVAAGERRVLASILAGNDDIPAKILDDVPDPHDLRLLQWIENMEREDLTLWERLSNLEMIIEEHKRLTTSLKVTASFIRDLIGCSLPHAMNYLAVLNAPAQIKKAIQKNELRSLEKAATICQFSSEEQRTEALALCKEGLSLKRLQELRRPKSVSTEVQKKRGRPAKSIKLGQTTRLGVVKRIVESVLKEKKYKPFCLDFDHVDWSDFNSANHAIKNLLALMEQLERE